MQPIRQKLVFLAMQEAFQTSQIYLHATSVLQGLSLIPLDPHLVLYVKLRHFRASWVELLACNARLGRFLYKLLI